MAQELGTNEIEILLLLGDKAPDRFEKPYAGLTMDQASRKFEDEEKIEWIGEPAFINGLRTSLSSDQVLGQGVTLSITLRRGI